MKLAHVLTALLFLGGTALAIQEVRPAKAKAQDAKPAAAVQGKPKAIDVKQQIINQVPSYPLTTCPISGDKLDKPQNYVHEGQLIRLCCKGCIKPVKDNPKPVVEKIQKAVAKAQVASYPIDTCLVTEDKLGSMGDTIDFVAESRLLRLCCKGCIKKVKAEPAKYIATVDKALIEKQKKTYPIKNCLVSGDAIDAMGTPTDYLYGTRLVRLCCKGCIKGFKKDPKKFLAKIDAAAGTPGAKGPAKPAKKKAGY